MSGSTATSMRDVWPKNRVVPLPLLYMFHAGAGGFRVLSNEYQRQGWTNSERYFAVVTLFCATSVRNSRPVNPLELTVFQYILGSCSNCTSLTPGPFCRRRDGQGFKADLSHLRLVLKLRMCLAVTCIAPCVLLWCFIKPRITLLFYFDCSSLVFVIDHSHKQGIIHFGLPFMQTACVTLFYTFFLFFFFFFFFFFSSSSSSSSYFSFLFILLLVHVADFTDVSEMELVMAETRLGVAEMPIVNI